LFPFFIRSSAHFALSNRGGRQRRLGQYSHQSDPAAAIHQTEPAGSQFPRQIDGDGRVPIVFPRTRSAEYADSFHPGGRLVSGQP